MKLKFEVVHFSGEDLEYPAIELNEHTPMTRGWQSARFCEYPQEIGLKVLDPFCFIQQLQLLSHQSKISSKIEIFLGNDNHNNNNSNYQNATFFRLGSLGLDANERSSFQARELKTVYIDRPCKYIRLIIHHCHVNKFNLFNQVSFIAINVLGDKNYNPSSIDNNDNNNIRAPGNMYINNNINNNDENKDNDDDDDNITLNSKDLYRELTIEATTAEKLKLFLVIKA